MTTINITFPAYVMPVESRGVTFKADLALLPEAIFLQIIPHGIKQKLADAVSGTPLACYMSAKPEGTAKPSRDQLTEWVEANQKTVDDAITAGMGKAWDAMVAGQWQVRVASGTSTKPTDAEAIALDLAKTALHTIFAGALAKAKPNAKPTATEFVALSPKVAAFFKPNASRPTWDDKAVLVWIAKQSESGARDFMQEAKEEMARRNAATEAMGDLDDLLGDI